jgi:quercetin dioxygenase-like cupin family protein
MTHLKRISGVLLCAGLAASFGLKAAPDKPDQPDKAEKAAHSNAAGHIIITPDQIKWAPGPPTLPAKTEFASLSGDMTKKGSLFTIRLRVPDGWKVPPHFHPTAENVTVIEGTLRMGLGDTLDESALTDLPAGSFHMIPKGVHHYTVAKGKTVIQLHAIGPWGITYVNPADDPSKQASSKQ